MEEEEVMGVVEATGAEGVVVPLATPVTVVAQDRGATVVQGGTEGTEEMVDQEDLQGGGAMVECWLWRPVRGSGAGPRGKYH